MVDISQWHAERCKLCRQALDVVQADLDSLSECCGRITGVLASTRHASADLLDETAKLRRLLEGSLHRSQLVDRFLEQYQLSHDEVYALQVRRSDKLANEICPCARILRRKPLQTSVCFCMGSACGYALPTSVAVRGRYHQDRRLRRNAIR